MKRKLRLSEVVIQRQWTGQLRLDGEARARMAVRYSAGRTAWMAFITPAW